MSRVDVKPELFRWARERARLEPAVLAERFPKYEQWETGKAKPTLKQLEVSLPRYERHPGRSDWLFS